MDFKQKFTRSQLESFADELQRISRRIGFKVSARGWCYLLEQSRMINKDEFDKVEGAINRCRRMGLLPVDFVAEEKSREFEGVEIPTDGSVKSVLKWMLRDVLTGHRYFKPDWWEGEEYYVQMVVEKIDLVTLFSDVTSEYHIPIANSKGWSSILQRAEYARRFREAEVDSEKVNETNTVSVVFGSRITDRSLFALPQLGLVARGHRNRLHCNAAGRGRDGNFCVVSWRARACRAA